jgi:hypothetical protein
MKFREFGLKQIIKVGTFDAKSAGMAFDFFYTVSRLHNQIDIWGFFNHFK